MPKDMENELVSEKIKLQEQIERIDSEMQRALDDFEKVPFENLEYINELIEDMDPLALLYGSDFFSLYVKLKVEYSLFINTFEEEKRFLVANNLENFLDNLQLLKKKLLE